MKTTGSVVKSPFFTFIHSRVPKDVLPRMGVVVGRRVGKAVTRNRLKRIIRELVRASYSDMALGHHCIVYPKIKILRSRFQEVEKAWNQILRQIGVIRSMRPE